MSINGERKTAHPLGYIHKLSVPEKYFWYEQGQEVNPKNHPSRISELWRKIASNPIPSISFALTAIISGVTPFVDKDSLPPVLLLRQPEYTLVRACTQNYAMPHSDFNKKHVTLTVKADVVSNPYQDMLINWGNNQPVHHNGRFPFSGSETRSFERPQGLEFPEGSEVTVTISLDPVKGSSGLFEDGKVVVKKFEHVQIACAPTE